MQVCFALDGLALAAGLCGYAELPEEERKADMIAAGQPVADLSRDRKTPRQP
jgi:hypothetical protein